MSVAQLKMLRNTCQFYGAQEEHDVGMSGNEFSKGIAPFSETYSAFLFLFFYSGFQKSMCCGDWLGLPVEKLFVIGSQRTSCLTPKPTLLGPLGMPGAYASSAYGDGKSGSVNQ
ncbi:hypothetical protein NC652_004903 [Populus alba x Populus x berolinensis]|nr:hypothetical protein NC652_004903 [Populus alba x Populus x berolinensis]